MAGNKKVKKKQQSLNKKEETIKETESVLKKDEGTGENTAGLSSDKEKIDAETEGKAKVNSEKDSQTKADSEKDSEAKEEFVEPDMETILEIKEERIKRKEDDSEEEEETRQKSELFRKLEFFWDYYKWFVIIPLIIIIITLVMIFSYIEESRERVLELAIINAVDLPKLIIEVDTDYLAFSDKALSDKDIRIESSIEYPNTNDSNEIVSNSEATSMEKFNAMVIAGRLDVAVTNTWVADIFSISDATTDLREICDEEFLKEREDLIYYAKNSEGEMIPVGFYVTREQFINSYDDDKPPIAFTVDTSPHKEETVRFFEWITQR